MSDASAPAGSVAVITGFAPGIGGALADRLIAQGYKVAGLSRTGKPHDGDAFRAYACDVTNESVVDETISAIETELGTPDVLVHNAARVLIRDFLDVKPGEFEDIWRTTCLSAMLCAQRVLPGMLEAGRGTIILTGATASVKGSAAFSAFASAKFALRGLSQSLARAYGPRGVHVAHTVIDGIIWGERADKRFEMQRDACMEPEDIAASYMALIGQGRSSWTQELDLRPSTETY